MGNLKFENFLLTSPTLTFTFISESLYLSILYPSGVGSSSLNDKTSLGLNTIVIIPWVGCQKVSESPGVTSTYTSTLLIGRRQTDDSVDVKGKHMQ